MDREGQVIYENKSIVKMHRFNLHMVPVSAIFFDSVPQCRYHQDFVHIDRGYSGFLHEQKESLYPFCARGKTTDADHPAGVTVRNWSVIF